MNQSSSGSYIVIINDEPFEAVFKEHAGLINQAIDIDLEIRERWYTVNGKNIPEVNILWYINGVTNEIVSGLDIREQILLLKDYLFAKKTIISLKNHRDSSVARAKKDYDSAVTAIFADQPDYKASCRSSVRFSCQILKAKLKQKEIDFKGSQTLTELADKLDAAIYEEVKEIIPWLLKIAEDGENNFQATREHAVNGVRSSVALFSKLFPEKTNKRADMMPGLK